MTRRVPVVVIAMLTIAVAIPFSSAYAEPIVITSGSLVLSDSLPSGAAGHLHGTQQFMADPVFFGTVNGGFACRPCGTPGMALSLTGLMDTVDGGGTVWVGGMSFRVGSIGGIPGTAILQLGLLAGSVVLPPLASGAVLSVPFQLYQSNLVVFDDEGLPMSFPVAGQGTATIELIPNRFRNDLWEFGRLRYEFQPVPEPATLLLLSAGMLALRVHRYRRGSRSLTRA